MIYQHKKNQYAFTQSHFYAREKGVGDFNSISLRGHKSRAGFTLIEMIIALSIFVLTVLIALNVYLIVNNVQRRTVAMQKVQDDVRYLFEAMAQEVRLGRINYDFYTDENNGIDLYPTVDGNSNYVLAVVNQQSESIFFRRSSSVVDLNDGLGDKVQYCAISQDNDCDLFNELDNEGNNKWQDVTPEGVKVDDLRFIITPSVDPYTEVGAGVLPDPCDEISNLCPFGYKCQTDNKCKFYTDGGNYQPKVRIVLKTESTDTRIPEKSKSINMQTVISSRFFQGKVQNNNYE